MGGGKPELRLDRGEILNMGELIHDSEINVLAAARGADSDMLMEYKMPAVKDLDIP